MFQENFRVKQDSNWLLKERISEIPKTFSYAVGAGEWEGVKSTQHSYVPAIPIKCLKSFSVQCGLD